MPSTTPVYQPAALLAALKSAPEVLPHPTPQSAARVAVVVDARVNKAAREAPVALDLAPADDDGAAERGVERPVERAAIATRALRPSASSALMEHSRLGRMRSLLADVLAHAKLEMA